MIARSRTLQGAVSLTTAACFALLGTVQLFAEGAGRRKPSEPAAPRMISYQFLTRDGQIVQPHRADAVTPSGETTPAPLNAASLRAQVLRLRKAGDNKRADHLEIYLKLGGVKTAAERHALISKLPVKIQRETSPTSTTTNFIVAGRVRLRTVAPVAAAPIAESLGGPSEALAPKDDCLDFDDQPDTCTDAQDVEDLTTLAVDIYASADSAQNDYDSYSIECGEYEGCIPLPPEAVIQSGPNDGPAFESCANQAMQALLAIGTSVSVAMQIMDRVTNHLSTLGFIAFSVSNALWVAGGVALTAADYYTGVYVGCVWAHRRDPLLPLETRTRHPESVAVALR